MLEELGVPLVIIAILILCFFLLKKVGATQEIDSHQALQEILNEIRTMLRNDAKKIPENIWSQTQTLVKKILVLQQQCQTRMSNGHMSASDCMELGALDEILVKLKCEGILRCAQSPREAQAVINEYFEKVDTLERSRYTKRHLRTA